MRVNHNTIERKAKRLKFIQDNRVLCEFMYSVWKSKALIKEMKSEPNIVLLVEKVRAELGYSNNTDDFSILMSLCRTMVKMKDKPNTESVTVKQLFPQKIPTFKLTTKGVGQFHTIIHNIRQELKSQGLPTEFLSIDVSIFNNLHQDNIMLYDAEANMLAVSGKFFNQINKEQELSDELFGSLRLHVHHHNVYRKQEMSIQKNMPLLVKQKQNFRFILQSS